MLSRCCTQRRWCVPHEAAINLNVCSGRSRDNFNFHRWFVPGGEHSRIFPALRCRGGRGITRAASASRPIIGYRLARVLHRITQERVEWLTIESPSLLKTATLLS
jgi:hypothetical protein